MPDTDTKRDDPREGAVFSRKEVFMANLQSVRNFYSVKEISVIIGFHPDTVYEWIQSKGMPVHRSGRRGRIAVCWPEFKEWWSEYAKK